MPRKGQILMAGPSSLFATGLVSQVTRVTRARGRRIVRVRAVPLPRAVPTLQFTGGLPLQASPPVETPVPKGRAAAGCDGPSTFDADAELTEFTVRRASAKLFPPQMSFELAVRTNARVGPKLIVAGISCSWKLAELGPWQGAIPTPAGFAIPVYATIPFTATASVEGSLSAFTFNVASTGVFTLDLGSYNNADFRAEGTNTWVDGLLEISGTASATLEASLEVGVGSAKGGNIHANAAFGSTIEWKEGQRCGVDVFVGRLTAGAELGPIEATTPPLTAKRWDVFDGCKDARPVGTAEAEKQAPPPPPPPPPVEQGPGTGPGPGPGSGQTPTPGPYREQAASGGARTFRGTNASGEGPRIAEPVGRRLVQGARHDAREHRARVLLVPDRLGAVEQRVLRAGQLVLERRHPRSAAVHAPHRPQRAGLPVTGGLRARAPEVTRVFA